MTNSEYREQLDHLFLSCGCHSCQHTVLKHPCRVPLCVCVWDNVCLLKICIYQRRGSGHPCPEQPEEGPAAPCPCSLWSHHGKRFLSTACACWLWREKKEEESHRCSFNPVHILDITKNSYCNSHVLLYNRKDSTFHVCAEVFTNGRRTNGSQKGEPWGKLLMYVAYHLWVVYGLWWKNCSKALKPDFNIWIYVCYI